jgi:hypothetical protein
LLPDELDLATATAIVEPRRARFVERLTGGGNSAVFEIGCTDAARFRERAGGRSAARPREGPPLLAPPLRSDTVRARRRLRRIARALAE